MMQPSWEMIGKQYNVYHFILHLGILKEREAVREQVGDSTEYFTSATGSSGLRPEVANHTSTSTIPLVLLGSCPCKVTV